ncbi:MAG: N-acetylmuramoyl-L-alanine amidase [Candidatus Cloacimonadota bacterium]|nr:MAG: N-acetylmuramoyl-L-alanine amidase [Candidatus Cloacimonadota bacterium]
MKRAILFISLIMLNSLLYSAIKVEFKSGLSSEFVQTELIDNIEYFNIFELNKVFKAIVNEDILDQRLKVNIYGQQLIILMDSSYLLFRGEQYNFTRSVVQENGKYYLPTKFLSTILPKLLPEKISFDKGKLIAEKPIDNSIKTIVIDPGHGGKDPGAIGYTKKNFEKNVALTVAKKLQKKIIDNLDVTVLLARDKDEFVSLQQRTQFANQNNADLFISIHCNAHRNSKVNGIEVFYLSTAKTDEARAVEALENQVVYDYEGGEEAVKKYDDLAFILADMAQSEHLEESYHLGTKLQAEMISKTKSHSRGVKQANFYVLRGAYMPAVLVEMGFISNKEEEKKLTNSSYQNKIVDAIFEGVKDFKIRYDNME